MTVQRPRLMIRHCVVVGDYVFLGNYTQEDPLKIDLENFNFYCNNASNNGSGVCCRKSDSAECPVFKGMVEQLVQQQELIPYGAKPARETRELRLPR